jgi:serine/threonine-protein kinase
MTDLLSRLKSALADRYAIERELGAGGMATVYLAQDFKHNRQVELKVLRPELAESITADDIVNLSRCRRDFADENEYEWLPRLSISS